MATVEQFSLRWNNFHTNITTGFSELLKAQDMVDVTLSVEGRFLQAHKLVLSICSPFFKQIFKTNPCKHPVIVLRDVTYGNLKDILTFIYLGEVNVLRDDLSAFLRTAEVLQVKGLTGDDTSDSSSSGYENEPEPLKLTVTPPLPPPPVKLKRSKNHGTSSGGKRAKCDINKNDVKQEEEELVEEEEEEEDDEETVKCEVGGSTNNHEVIKQLLENSFGGQQDGDTYSSDPKTHVFCPYCGRKFVNRYNLKVHMRDKHDANPLINLDCDVCGKTMRNQSCLRVHRYHHRKQKMVDDGADRNVAA